MLRRLGRLQGAWAAAKSRPWSHRALVAVAVVGINVAPLLIASRSVVFGDRTLLSGATLPGNEGIQPSFGFPSTAGGGRSEEDGSIIRPTRSTSLDPAASAYQFEPQVAKAHQELSDGRLPLWTANVGLGMPLAGNAQSGVFNPLEWPLLAHPNPRYWDGWLLARLLIGGLCATALAWYLGVRWGFAAMAGVVFELSGQLVTHVTDAEVSVEVFLPLLVLGLELCIRARKRLGMTVTAVALALSVLGGMPEQTLICVTFAGLYALGRLGALGFAARSWRPMVAPLTAMAGGTAVGVALAMPLIATFGEFVSAGYNFHTAGSNAAALTIGSQTLPALAVPRWTGTQPGEWVGIGALVLAVLGLRGGVLARSVVWVLVVVGGFLTLKLYGIPSVLNQFMDIVPVYERIFFFRYAGIATSLAIALLAAAGLERLVRSATRPPWWEVAGAIALVAVLAGSAFASEHDLIVANTSHVRAIVLSGLLFVALAGSLALALRGGRIAAVATAAICVLVTVEIGLISSPINPQPLRADNLAETPTTQYLRTHVPSGSGRVAQADTLLGADLSEAYGFDSLLILDAIFPERYARYMRSFVRSDFHDRLDWGADTTSHILGNPFVDALNLGYIVASSAQPIDASGPPPRGQLEVVATTSDGATVLRNTRALSRATVFHAVVHSPGEDATLSLMTDPAFDPRRTAVVEADGLPASSGAAPEAARMVSYSDDRMVVQTSSREAGVLVVADAWYPGWTATVDGVAAPIVPANLALRGVVVTAGAHTVVMEYRPRSATLGLLGAAAGLLALVGIWAAPPALRRVRRRGVPAP